MRSRKRFAIGSWCLLALVALVSALVAVPARAATEVLYIAATGHYVRGVFRDFWDKNGGLANFGYPLTEEYIDPGTSRVYQYFERARFERASPSATAVDLGLIGREIAGNRTFAPTAPITNSAQRAYFPQTKHIVQYGFKETWDTRGGLRIFGYPISDEVEEQLGDGKTYTVQYFERARFEYHPDLPAGQRVLLSLLGRQLAPPALLPPVAPNSPPTAPIVVQPGSPTTPTPPATPAPVPMPPPNGQPPLTRPILPESKDGEVLPHAGEPGQTFFFRAFGFKAGERVGIWLNSPDGSLIGANFQATANAGGAIDTVSFRTDKDVPLGVWSFVAQGVTSQKQSIGYFLLLSDAIGRNLPPAASGPPVPANVNARVDPPAGKAGTIFFFDAWGFAPGEEVAPAIFASDGTPIRVDYTVKADAKGSIHDAGLYFVTETFYPLGLWRFEAKGKTSGATSVGYFVLTP